MSDSGVSVRLLCEAHWVELILSRSGQGVECR